MGDGSEPDFIAVVIQPPMFFGETRLLFDLWCLNIFDIQLWGWLNPMGFNGELPIPVSWLQKPMESIKSVTILAVKYTVCQHVSAWLDVEAMGLGGESQMGFIFWKPISTLYTCCGVQKNWPCNLHTKLTKRVSSSKR